MKYWFTTALSGCLLLLNNHQWRSLRGGSFGALSKTSRRFNFLFLTSRDLLLHEVVVRGLPTENQFKRQLLKVNLPPSQEETNAHANVAIARRLYLAGYVPLMDSRDNYQWQLQELKEITLFSSRPTKGLPKALRDLFRSNQLRTPTPMPSRQATPDLHSTLRKMPDSLYIIQP